MKRIKTFAQLFESVNPNRPEVARMKIYFNIQEDLDDEESEIINGLYADLLINLGNTEEVFNLDGEGNTRVVEGYFKDGGIPGVDVSATEALKIEFGSGPYTLKQLGSHEMQININDIYQTETLDGNAYTELEVEGTPITSYQFSTLLSMRDELGDARLKSIFGDLMNSSIGGKWNSYTDDIKVALYTPDLTFLSPEDHKMLSAAQSVQKKSGLY
jgi:hypothetical protein